MAVNKGQIISTQTTAQLITTTVPANALGTANLVEVTGMWIGTTTNVGEGFSIGGTYGGQQIGSSSISVTSVDVRKEAGTFTVSLLADSSATAQQGTAMLHSASTTAQTAQVNTLSVDSTVSQTLTIYGANNAGGGVRFEPRNIAVKLWQ